ncbi:MAG TPA: circularly permuted type 2 ATP-grasp protein [Acidimicrobiales bacterium]|nr:circularly permuted type 2 ATP-grasp protein [Acidimicrobiales bacterium]
MTATASPDVVAGYRPPAGAYDEMVDGDGRFRAHWAQMGPALDRLGMVELRRRRSEASRLLDDDGVTYHVYGKHRTVAPRWALDPVPVLVPSEDWARVEAGVIQRAELLNWVLADLYGARESLRQGWLPREVVYDHPGFLRPCDGVALPGPHQLFTAAVDLVRDARGGTWVLADRTQAPSGAGYAIENRVVMSRVLPSLYRDAQVHRLAPFVRALRAGLRAVAPPGVEDPRIVVLTPGAQSETAFEHAFLAAHLGYSLVEGSDLVVQDAHVWMRSLGQHQAVHVILRRVDAAFCDPLELWPRSFLGVPGLVEACRRGSVSVVNTLGSGVLENPALPVFLPALARRILGEELELPSVPTWWCGDPESRRFVLARLDSLVVRPIARSSGGPAALNGWQLSAAERDDLRRRIEARPHRWVGQEQLELASAPTLGEATLEARRSMLRTFLVARGDSYLVMPGGLTRVAASDGAAISNQAGALSKDTWVLASEPDQMAGVWISSGPPVPAVEPEASISARTAENLVWLGRYAERAEGVLRLLRVVQDRRNDFADGAHPAGVACVRVLLEALTEVTSTQPGFAGGDDQSEGRRRDPGDELYSLITDADREGTLAFAVRHLVGAAHAARDQLSMDTWLVISSLQRELPEGGGAERVTLQRVLASLLALAGLEAESRVRDPGWRFLDAGRRIERGAQLAALLRATVTVTRDAATDSLILESVLIATESILTYRRRYRSHAQLETLLDLMLLDPDNPRSLRYQLDRLLEDLRALPGHPGPATTTAAERTALEAWTALRVADTAALARQSRPSSLGPSELARQSRLSSLGPSERRGPLDGLLMTVEQRLYAVADLLAEDHFAGVAPQRALATPADPQAARASHWFLP